MGGNQVSPSPPWSALNALREPPLPLANRLPQLLAHAAMPGERGKPCSNRLAIPTGAGVR